MNNKHIHEIINYLVANKPTFKNKEAFIEHISVVFGEDARYGTCSMQGIDNTQAFDFLMDRQKISYNDKQEVILHPNLITCEDH